MDESGNTGEPRYVQEKNVWNWDDQEVFALGAVGIRQSVEVTLRDDLRKILHSFDPDLGTKKEWKSTRINPYDQQLMKEVLSLLQENKATIFEAVRPLMAGSCNIVSTQPEQEKFFSAFGLRTVMTPIPNLN